MTPKEQYDARKAGRLALKDLDYQTQKRMETTMTLDLIDRFVTAIEDIAMSLERSSYSLERSSYKSNTYGGAGGR